MGCKGRVVGAHKSLDRIWRDLDPTGHLPCTCDLVRRGLCMYCGILFSPVCQSAPAGHSSVQPHLTCNWSSGMLGRPVNYRSVDNSEHRCPNGRRCNDLCWADFAVVHNWRRSDRPLSLDPRDRRIHGLAVYGRDNFCQSLK